jgi:predicted transport protein
VCTEFTVGNFRIDTLAYNRESKSFVIIEYKRDKNFSIIDQGYAYLSLMLNNKADFILEYHENSKKTLKKSDVDWSLSKVAFVAPVFTTYQREAINFKDLPIELWEVRKFENDTISYNEIKKAGAQESIKTISKQDETIKQVSAQVKVLTEDFHLDKVSPEVKELYYQLQNDLLNEIENIHFNVQKYYISLRVKRNFAFLSFTKNKIRLVAMTKVSAIKKAIKHYEISKLTQSVQDFYNGECASISIDNGKNLSEIVNLLTDIKR